MIYIDCKNRCKSKYHTISVKNTEGVIKMDNREKLVTQGTQDEEKQNKNNPEKLVTQGTQDEEKQNKNNPEKLVTQGTQDEEKQSKNTT